MHLLRSTLCIDSPVLPLTMQSFVSLCLQRSMSIWVTSDGAKHLCPSGGGGLSVRSVVLLAPSAYLASAASSTELTSILLPARLRDVKDSGVNAALAAWTSQAANPLEVSTPTPPTSTVYNVNGMNTAVKKAC